MELIKGFQKICHPMGIKLNQDQNINNINSIYCFSVLKTDKKAQLIDVRTISEW